MEGLRFPDFDFIDLNGDRFSTESTAGQLKIIKTLFINCVACVKEFPELNTFVEKNSNKKDVIFLSLATDAKPELDLFLKKKPFSYKVVSNQNTFIVEKLKLQIYPTHIVVDKNGKILKVVNKASEMISFFEDYNESEAIIAPTPPSI
jgi:thiol-disulfide isomerase/thioredoxin